jgi:hypothetical protein
LIVDVVAGIVDVQWLTWWFCLSCFFLLASHNIIITITSYHTHLPSQTSSNLRLLGMMNEGLEALATLASTAPPSPAWSELGPHNASQNTNENPFSSHAGSNGNATASTSSGPIAAAPMRSHPLLSASNLNQTPQNGNLSQWQQALQQQCGNGMNPSVSNSNLALLMGMQRQQSQPHPQADQFALLQQQLSYYRYNMNNQSGNQMAAAGTGDRGVHQQANNTSLEPHQALALSLVLQTHQSVQKNGKSLIPVGTFVSFRSHWLRPSSLILSGD